MTEEKKGTISGKITDQTQHVLRGRVTDQTESFKNRDIVIDDKGIKDAKAADLASENDNPEVNTDK